MIRKTDYAVRFHKYGFQTEEHVLARSAKDAIHKTEKPYQGIWTTAEVYNNQNELKAYGRDGKWQYT